MTKSTRSFVAVGLAAALALAACGGDDGDEGASGGESEAGECGGILGDVEPLEGVTFTPVTDDTFTIVTSLPGPGFWTGGDTIDAITGGLEYCMAQVMQRQFGLGNFSARNEAFQAITTGVVQDYDLALTQSSITDEREEVVDFTESYYKSDQSLIVAAGTEVATIEDVRGLTIGAQVGTTGEFFATSTDPVLLGMPAEQVQSFDTLNAAYTALQAGQVDAVIMDTAINLGQALQSDGAFEVVAQFANEDFYGGIMPEGSENKAAIDAAIMDMIDSGVLAQLLASELGGDPASVTFIELG
jgi:polar amino acid transport system substrate-binding protein